MKKLHQYKIYSIKNINNFLNDNTMVGTGNEFILHSSNHIILALLRKNSASLNFIYTQIIDSKYIDYRRFEV